MPGFDFFRTRRTGYVPRTPAGALKAIGAGLLPVESFVYASTSVKPLDEEPFDLDAIERMLARTDLGIQTTSQLKSILEKLIATDDQEKALFGAEGINTLEGRFINRIEALRVALAKNGDAAAAPAARPTTLRELARQYRDLAALHGKEMRLQRRKGSSISAFYLREAFHALREAHHVAGGRRLSRNELSLMVDILLALGLAGQAAQLLGQVRVADDPLVLFLQAGVAFHQRQYARVTDCCRKLAPRAEALAPRDRKTVAFWAGDADA